MPTSKRSEMKDIQSWDEVPAFASEAEEARFWSTHGLGKGVAANMAPLPRGVLPEARPRPRPIAVRFDEDVIRRLRALRGAKHKG